MCKPDWATVHESYKNIKGNKQDTAQANSMKLIFEIPSDLPPSITTFKNIEPANMLLSTFRVTNGGADHFARAVSGTQSRHSSSRRASRISIASLSSSPEGDGDGRGETLADL